MFKKYTYKQKFQASIVLFVLLLLAIYKKNFKHVFNLYKELNLVEKQISEAQISNQDLFVLNNQLKDLDALIGGQSNSPDLVQHDALDFITTSLLQVEVVNIEKRHKFQEGEFNIHTNQIEIQGAYKDLITLLYKFENEFNSSRISSVKMYSKRNYKEKKKKIVLKIILQNYEKI